MVVTRNILIFFFFSFFINIANNFFLLIYDLSRLYNNYSYYLFNEYFSNLLIVAASNPIPIIQFKIKLAKC